MAGKKGEESWVLSEVAKGLEACVQRHVTASLPACKELEFETGVDEGFKLARIEARENEIERALKREHRKGFVLILDEVLGVEECAGDLGRLVEQVVMYGAYDPSVFCTCYVSLAREDPDRVLEAKWRALFESDSLALEGTPVEDLARIPGPVLIEGGIGTGKTYLARQVASARLKLGLSTNTEVPILVENFGAVRADVVDSLLRGVAKGSFTGVSEKKGLFQRAHKGVLVLDDFQNATAESQIRLLDLLDPTTDLIRLPYRHGADEGEGHFEVKVLILVNEPVDVLIREKRLRPDILSRMRQRYVAPTLKEDFVNYFDPTHGEHSRPRLKYLIRSLAIKHAPALRAYDDSTCDWHATTLKPGSHHAWRITREAFAAISRRSFPDNARGLEKLIADLQESARESGMGLFDVRSITRIKEAKVLHPNPMEGPSAVEVRPQFCITSPEATHEQIHALMRAVGDATGWVDKDMALHLHPIRKQGIKKYLQEGMPEALEGTRWEVQPNPESGA